VRLGIITPGYFHTLGVPLIEGRDFNSADTEKSLRVAIVSQTAVKKFWKGKSPVGGRLRFAGEADSLGWATVVGVVGDVLQNIEDNDQRLEQVYIPHDQEPVQYMYFTARSNLEPATLISRMRNIVQGRNADLPLIDARTFREHVRFSMWTHRLFMSLFTTFAILALLIAGIGIYGVMSYSVTQRTQEIGIRMALGADQAAVVGMVTMQALKLTLLGVIVGLAGAFGVTRFMQGMLFNVSATDPPTFTIVCVVLALSGVIAAWLPASRASRVNPVVALRYE
jgi:putative ABC transport system permease protein